MHTDTTPALNFAGMSSPGWTRRARYRSERSSFGYSEDDSISNGYSDCDVTMNDAIPPENSVEAQRLVNNRRFGFRKWKSHVTSRPLSSRSAIVRSLYSTTYQPVLASTLTVGNVAYVALFGWWLALVYAAVAGLMFASRVGKRYGTFCLMMAKYFIWPFGKFIHWNSCTYMTLDVLRDGQADERQSITLSHNDETEPIIRPSDVVRSYSDLSLMGASCDVRSSSITDDDDVSADVENQDEDPSREPLKNRKLDFRSPEAIVWLAVGVPLLGVTHAVVFLLSWLPVIFIPIAKINGRTLTQFLLLPPDALRVEETSVGASESTSDIVLYIHQAVNVYYYKYTLDGMNVILVNMLSIVLIAIVVGYADSSHTYANQETKFTLALMSIIPLAYYIGMAITSLSAQTLPAIGALLNATFGSIVEIILYISSLVKERREHTVCYAYLVKASLVGTLLATTLLIPGIAMVVGGLRHSTQRFNPRSTAVSATLLFVSVAVVFAPSIFSSALRSSHCSQCVNATPPAGDPSNQTWSLDCKVCYTQSMEEFAQSDMYDERVAPLAYACVTVLLLAYVVGLVFSLKTHKVHVYDSFVPDVVEGAAGGGHGHGAAQWGRVKSVVILLVSTVVMCVCADLLVYNIEPIINESSASINFIGVTLLAIVPDIPEIVIGIQFALQNSITMSIEVGCNIATQVCMVQIPLLVFTNLVYPVGFHLLFSEIHIWSVALAVFMMNYTFQDGKSDYFQGSALVLAYIAFICMYYYMPDPPALNC